MHLGRRIWTALVLALVVWFLPTQAFCFDRDEYAFKSALGRVYFEYERRAQDQNGNKNTSNRFLQRYSLDFKGYVLNRRLLIYDFGYSYTNNDYRSKSTHNNRGTSNYYLKTTALPLSAIPLSLWASRRTTRTTSDTESTTTEDKYGMRWYLYFRTLPKTTLSAERDKLTGNDGSESVTDTYRLDMEKEIGPTKNFFSYYLVNSDTSTGSDSSRQVINFVNQTKISRNSTFYLGATRSDGESSVDPRDEQTGLSMSLFSTPSKDFSQRHAYNFYENKNDGSTMTGSSYTGNMDYKFTKDLSSFFTLNIDNRKSTSETFESDSVALGTTMTVNYRLTDRTSLSQLLSYANVESNSNDPAANLTDTETIRTLTSVIYTRRLNWTSLRASAGVGYTDEKSERDISGQAIEQRYTLTLSDIDLNKYIGANSSLNYNSRSTISGNDIDSSSYAFNLNLYNKEWKKYVVGRASYTRSASQTYISDFRNRKETYRINAVSNYFKKTRLTASAAHSKVFEELIGNGRSTTLSFGASHTRNFYKGQLAASYSFTTTKSSFEGGSDKVNTTVYSLNYSKTLMKVITWRFLAQRVEQEASNSFSNTTTVKNSIVYPLRSWLLSGDHEYKINEYTNTKRTETILLLRVTRTFVRIW